MTRVKYDDVAGLPDAMNTMDFEFVFCAIPGSRDSNELRIACQTGTLPGRQNQALLLQLHGHDMKFSGKAEQPKTISITFAENVSMGITKKLRIWMEQCRGSNSATSTGYKRSSGSSSYARDVVIYTYDTTGKKNMTCTLLNVFPEDVPDVNLDGTNSQLMLLNATFSYDKCIYDIVTQR